MKILVVEDELKTGNYLKQGLAEAGFGVDLARDGDDGLHYALTDAYDLVILDVMLPGIDGWAVLQGIRKSGKDMPVLFLHAEYDYVCETLDSGLAGPMRAMCADLTEARVPSGHWMAQEKPLQVNAALVRWLVSRVPQALPFGAG